MSLVSDFKEFAVKGNAFDLAVGVIIGAAFGKIVDSVVSDLIMPIIGGIFGKVDFSNLFIVLGSNPLNLTTRDALNKAGVPILAYGNFITVLINFIILALVVFCIVRMVNKVRNQPAVEAPPEDVLLLREIRDSLKR